MAAHVIVLANRTAAAPELIEALVHRSERGPIHATLVMPVATRREAITRTAAVSSGREVGGLPLVVLVDTPGAHPGIEFKAELTGRDIVSRVYIVGRRPYQLIALTPQGRDSAAVNERFFSSFKLLRTAN